MLQAMKQKGYTWPQSSGSQMADLIAFLAGLPNNRRALIRDVFVGPAAGRFLTGGGFPEAKSAARRGAPPVRAGHQKR
jgi:hypothetical protein